MDGPIRSPHLIRRSPLLSPAVIYLKNSIREEPECLFSFRYMCDGVERGDDGGRVSTLSQE